MTVEEQQLSKQETIQSTPRHLRRVPLWLYGFVAFAFVLLYMLQFHDCASIDQYDYKDHSQAFATPFYVVDNGYLSLRGVFIECDYVRQDGSYLAHMAKAAGDLTFKNRQTLPCAVNADSAQEYRGEVVFTVKIDYRIAWLPLHRSQAFRFKSVSLSDGTRLWLQQ